MSNIDDEMREKIKKLHDVSNKIAGSSSEEEVFDMIIDASKNILEFYVCSIDIVEDEEFEVKGTIGGVHKKGDRYPVEGVAGETIKRGESFLINNVQNSDLAEPKRTKYNSVISVPIGDMGVFQAISDKIDYFDEYDLELAELLVSHLTETLKRIKKEKNLQISEKRYRAIFDNTGTAKVILKKDLTIDMVNKEFEKLSGYDNKDIEGHMKFDNFVYEDNLDDVTYHIETSTDKGKKISKKLDLKFIDKFGHVKDTIGALSKIPGSSEFTLSLLDITDFKWAIEELERSEKQYRTIFEKTETPMLIIRKDTVIELINSKFVEVFGYSKDDIRNEKSWTEFVVEHHLQKMKTYHEKRRKDPDSVPSSYECEVYDRSGNKRRVLLKVGMIPGTEKSLVSIIDLSDEESVGFDKYIDRLNIGLAVLDPSGTIIDTNKKFLELFIDLDKNMIGIDYRETILSCHQEKIEDILKNERNYQIETLEIRKEERNTFKIELNYSLIRKQDENYILVRAYPVSEK